MNIYVYNDGKEKPASIKLYIYDKCVDIEVYGSCLEEASERLKTEVNNLIQDLKDLDYAVTVDKN